MLEIDLLKLWAKRRRDTHFEILYPLLFHMLDVACVVQALWYRSFQADTRAQLAQAVGPSDTGACLWISFWAGLHDLGKASPVFQRASIQAQESLAGLGFAFDKHVQPIPHGSITEHVFARLVSGTVPGAGPPDLLQAIGTTVGGHHGVTNLATPGPRQRGNGLWEDARMELCAVLADLLGLGEIDAPCHCFDTSFYVMLAGLTSVADWIGSNEDYFPLGVSLHSPVEHLEYARSQADKALDSLGWTDWTPPGIPTDFATILPNHDLRPLQRAVTEMAPSVSAKPSLVIIEAPMGEGKTEAAIYLADQWCARLGQKGCYFALPTQATSNQMYGRVKKFLEDRYPNSHVGLQLIHGGALLSSTTAAVCQTEDGKADGADDGSAGQWFLPKKRGLLAPFGVGTIDQALLAVLQTRHYFVRLFGLAHKTVIVDEVHAYDTYMSTLLEALLAWLRSLGCSVIMLSATLPPTKRARLLQAYGPDIAPPKASSYPRISFTSGADTRVTSFAASTYRVLNIVHIPDDIQNLVQRLESFLQEGGCVAIVCNTVRRAQEAYSALKNAGFLSSQELMLLHARYPFEERESREEQALLSFGKHGPRPHRLVLVTTQIVEQSLDLDFDLMVSDLAPVDLVLQRAGRVHRHVNNRPKNLATPQLWLRMPIAGEDSVPLLATSSRVYEEYYLLLSYLCLSRSRAVTIPDDLERLIEDVYEKRAVDWPSRAFEEAVDRAREKMLAREEAATLKAATGLIPQPGDDPLDFLDSFNRQLEEDDPEVHRSLQALTRLAEPSVQLVCLSSSGDGVVRLRQGDSSSVDMDDPPHGAKLVQFLRRSLTVTDKRVVFHLLNQPPPPAWRRCPALRHHRAVIFDDGASPAGDYILNLHEELGLSIEKIATGESEENDEG